MTHTQQFQLTITDSNLLPVIGISINPEHGAVIGGAHNVTVGNDAKVFSDGKLHPFILVNTTFKTLKPIGASEAKFEVIQ